MTLGGASTQAAEPPELIPPSPSSQGSLTADTGSVGSCPPRLDPPAEVVPSPSDGRPGAFDDLRRFIYVRSPNLAAPRPSRPPQKFHRSPEQFSPSQTGRHRRSAPERGTPHTSQGRHLRKFARKPSSLDMATICHLAHAFSTCLAPSALLGPALLYLPRPWCATWRMPSSLGSLLVCYLARAFFAWLSPHLF